MQCPYCKQEDIWKIDVKQISAPAFICAECDTIWLTVEDIKYGKGKNFEDFVSERGFEGNWNNVVKKERVD